MVILLFLSFSTTPKVRLIGKGLVFTVGEERNGSVIAKKGSGNG